MVLSVGQFIHRKGFDILLKAIEADENVGVYIVGGTPTKEYVSLCENRGLNNVHFVEFCKNFKNFKKKLKNFKKSLKKVLTKGFKCVILRMRNM